MLRNLVATAAIAVAVAAPASAQHYPTTTIKIVVPSAQGGASDPPARLVAEHLRAVLGQPAVVEHRPGAGGVIGAQHVIGAPADGHTLLLGNFAQVVAPLLNPKITFNIDRDLAPIGSLVTFGNVLLVGPSVKAANLAELIAQAKARPGTLQFASPGAGQSQHLSGEMFKRMANIDIVHVPYKGTGPATTDLIGGHVHMMFGNIPSALPFIESGKLRAFAVTGPKRSAALPNVPTVQEAGVPGMVVTSWLGLLAPAATPRAIVDRLNDEVTKAWSTPDAQKLLRQMHFDWSKHSADDMRAFIRGEQAKWSKLIKEANIKVD